MGTEPAARGLMRRGALAAFLLAAAPAGAEAPLSAIDWLSESVSPGAAPPPGRRAPVEEPPKANGSPVEDIATSVLGAATPDAAGLLPAAATGLPRDLWGASTTADLIALIGQDRADLLPAERDLLALLLLAELDPPHDSAGKGAMLLARVDRLLTMGMLDQAQALIAVAGDGGAAHGGAELFRRSFDVALLIGTEDASCAQLRHTPGIAPTYPARIFCLARGGDWGAAALTLTSARAIGEISDEEDAILSRFLDPDLFEGEPPLPPPQRVTPLIWRIYEAIGEPLPTNTLPLAFAHADLRPTTGWKGQIEAAERLARAGAVEPTRLFALYGERLRAASGGVWERVEAIQRFDTALRAGDAAAVAATLPRAWALMQEAELEVPFAEQYGEAILALPLAPEAAAIAWRVALLSPGYEGAARARMPATAEEAFLAGLARGSVAGLVAPGNLGRAIAPAFSAAPDATRAPDLAALLAENRRGEAILRAIDRVSAGAAGELRMVAEGLALWRQLGLESAARRTALQLLLLDRRG